MLPYPPRAPMSPAIVGSVSALRIAAARTSGDPATYRLLTEWAFSELGMERLELLISVENEGSKRVAVRCGYVREGVLRSRHLKGDLREDTEIWSRLPSDA